MAKHAKKKKKKGGLFVLFLILVLVGVFAYFYLNPDKDVKDVKFSCDKNIDEPLQSYKSYFWLVLFWIGWVILIGVSVFGFWMIDNRWLEDR